MDISEVFNIYRPLFKQCLTPTVLLPHLLKQGSYLNVKDHIVDITMAQSSNTGHAAELMLSAIEANRDRDKFNRLVCAMKEAGFEDLAENLEGIQEIKDDAILKSWMEHHFDTLQTLSISDKLLQSLKSKGTLKHGDVKDISDMDKKHGRIRAVFFMFAVVVRNKTGWAELFIEALRETDFKKQAYVLETGSSQGYEKRSPEEHTCPEYEEQSTKHSLTQCPASVNPQSIGDNFQRLSPVGAEDTQGDPTGETQQSPLASSRAVGGKAHDIAMDSDEEAEMLEQAIQRSLVYSILGNEEDNTPVKQQLSQSSSIDDKSGESFRAETTPKQRLADATNPSKQSMESTKSQGAITKTSSDGFASKQEKRANYSESPALDELRSKRLARFGGEQTSPEKMDISGEPPYKKDGKNVANDSKSRCTKHDVQPCAETTLPQSLDLTVTSSLSEPTTSRVSNSQEDSDFVFASRLQEEEYSLSAMTTDENVTMTPDLNDLSGAGGRSLSTSHRMNIQQSGAADNKVPKIKLRNYQEELAEPAKDGTNTVIVAPTGSGKTIVALDIAKDHFDTADVGEESKVGFVVPTVALVDQQRNQFQTFFNSSSDKRVVGISGDSTLSKKASFKMQLEDCDIAVFTPQLLIDSIRKKEIEKLGVFSLLIFDECHHSMKDHPYNIIMNIYFEQKQKGFHPLPQLVGLTASVGVGKADSIEKTEAHIITLCASLDSQIVTVTKHTEELKKYVNNPTESLNLHPLTDCKAQLKKNEVNDCKSSDIARSYQRRWRGDREAMADSLLQTGTEPVPCRLYDPFKDKVTEMMAEIECKMRKASEKITFTKSADFQKGMKPPSGRDTELYTQWISAVDQFVMEIEEEEIQRIFVQCSKYLKIYNKALLVNADCRAKDAFKLIADEMRQINFPKEFKDGIDKQLHDMFQAKKQQLETDSEELLHDKFNPKLKKLKEILIEEYCSNTDLRGIIFCKTRDLTEALKNWINEDEIIKILNPHKLVGTHAPATSGGMTSRNIEDVLSYFRDGTHKIIVATTVAEEGLDIQKCNLVIRYEHVTNEIARTQAKGRGRAQDAKYILIGEIGRGAIEKDRINKMREKMMKKALENISKLINHDKQEYWARIGEQQGKLAIDREMKQLGQSQKRVINKSNDAEDFELRCKKCNRHACFASDIRKIEGAHHVVINEDFEDVVHIDIYPRPTTYKNFTQKGRLYCKNCSEEWGTQADYKSIFFHVLSVKGFMFVDSNRRKGKFKKWKDVPFQVPNLSVDELKALVPSANITESHKQILELRD